MADAEILHRLYTNAAEEGAFDGARGRVVEVEERDASRVVTPDVLNALDDLLRKTSPSSTQTGWVVRRFAKGNQSYACVIASYPDLVDAADGRAGVLNHARLIAVDAPSFDASALIDVANEFPIADVCAVPSTRRLRTYLNEIGNESAVLLRPVSLPELQQEPRDVLTDVLLGCLATHGRREHVAMSIADARAIAVARAWAALPPATQRASSWAVGVKESCPVDVIFSSSHGQAPVHTSSKALVECVKQYVHLVHAAPEAVSAMLANASLSDKTAFAAAVQRAAIAPEVSSLAGREEMTKKERVPKAESREPRTEWQPLDADVRAEMNRQFKAMEEVLRRAMDERLAAFEAKQRAQAPSRSERATLAGSLLPLWITAGVFVLAALAWLGYRTFGPRTEPVQRPSSYAQRERYEANDPEPSTTNEAPQPNPVQSAIARAQSTPNLWPDEFKALLENDRDFVAGAVSSVAARDEVPRDAKAALANFATRIARGDDLQVAGREKLRALLLECLASDIDGAKVKIDGKLNDVAPHLDALKNRYRVSSTSDDATQMSLQSEILLRWLSERER